MKRAKRTIVILGLALAGCSGPVYVPTATPNVVSVRMMATTTTYPLLQDLAAEFNQPGMLLAVSGQAGSWSTIYDQMQAGTLPFALTNFVPDDGPLWLAPIGYDALVIVVHPDNDIPEMTMNDLRNLFQGRVSRWSELGGPDLPVTIVSRERGGDMRRVFDHLVMGQRRTTLAARLALSGGSVVGLVADTPGAVGYVSLADLEGRVRPVPIAREAGGPAYPPTRDLVGGGQYPLRTPLQIVGLSQPEDGSVYRDWFAWMQSEEGQRIVGARLIPLQGDELSR